MPGIISSNNAGNDFFIKGHFVETEATAGYSRSGKAFEAGGRQMRLVLEGDANGKVGAVVAREITKSEAERLKRSSKEIVVKILDTDTNTVKMVAISKKSLKKRYRLSSRQIKELQAASKSMDKFHPVWKALAIRAGNIASQHLFIGAHINQKADCEDKSQTSWEELCRHIADWDQSSSESKVIDKSGEWTLIHEGKNLNIKIARSIGGTGFYI